MVTTVNMDKENNFVLREAVKAAQMGYYDHLAAGGKRDPAEERWIEALEAGADAISKVHVLETQIAKGEPCCSVCAYNFTGDGSCKDYIRKLESRLAQVEKDLAFKEKCLEWRYNDIARAEDMIDDLNAKLAQAERERDAAVHDMRTAVKTNAVCIACKHDRCKENNFDCANCKSPCMCQSCHLGSNYEWHGLCPENTMEE